jgi:hypothetical protein
MTTPNRYGSLARDHMERYLPSRYAQIEDPDRYFSGLGEEIVDRVRELQPAMAGEAPPGEGWLEQVGRMNMARLMAEEVVFAEMVFLPPEADPDEDPQPGDWVGTFPFYLEHEPQDRVN